jgi:copper chaperone CopZ
MMSESIVLKVTGMKCGGCESNVSTKLLAVDGVLSVVAQSKANQVQVEFDADKVNQDTIEDTIIAAGFNVVEDDDE